MPQAYPNMPPRPEFIPFTVQNLCILNPYDGGDFWTYPERCGWIVNDKDTQCHVFCPPGTCHEGLTSHEMWEDGRVIRPLRFTRSDGNPVLASEKVAFLQAWFFFGMLEEISTLCGLVMDTETEFVVEDGQISTAKLNGLPGRWLEAASTTGKAGNTTLMKHILALARHSYLMLTEEANREDTPVFFYTYSECRILHSLDILIRIIGLHLLLHGQTPGFEDAEGEGWHKGRVWSSLDWSLGRREGMKQLGDMAAEELKHHGWCASELTVIEDRELQAFASLLPRSRVLNHSHCGNAVCGAYQTDEITYQTKHVGADCNCDFVGIETSALINVLSEAWVPRVVITEDLELQLVSEDYPYYAISHVCTLISSDICYDFTSSDGF